MTTEQRFLLDPQGFVQHTVLEPYHEGVEHPGFFHVTTQASIIERERVMKSRRDLASQGIQGLGGGPQHSPHLISTVFDLGLAQKLWSSMRTVVRAVHLQISATDLALAMLEWTSFPEWGDHLGWDEQWEMFLNERDPDEDDEDDEEGQFAESDIADTLIDLLALLGIEAPDNLLPLLKKTTWIDLIDQHRPQIERTLATPEERYRFVQEFEKKLSLAFHHLWDDSEGLSLCVPLVGYVAPFALFKKIQVDQIAIVQLAVAEGAAVELEPEECEMRFRPEDTRVVRVRCEEQGPLRWKNETERVYKGNPLPEGEVGLKKEDFEVRNVPFRDAVEFIQAHHYAKSTANTATALHGLYEKSTGRLVGVAWWMPSLPQAHKSAIEFVKDRTGMEASTRMVLHLSRLVVLPDQPKNAAGFLLSRSMRLIDRRRFPILLTFADLSVVDLRTGKAHTGTIYKATNWLDAGVSPGGRVWVHKETGEQRGQKRKGKNIPSAEMRAMGYEQRKSQAKQRFIHVDENALWWALNKGPGSKPS